MEPSISLRCRICLKYGVEHSDILKDSDRLDKNVLLTNLFSNNTSQLLHLKIMSCAKTLISQDDDLPQFICYLCTENLETSFNFRKQCEKSDEELRVVLNKIYSPEEPFNIHKTFIKNSPYFNDQCTDHFHKSLCINKSLKSNTNTHNSFALEPIQTILTESISNKVSITERKCFQCETCGKIFSKRSHLIVHVRMHTGEKPFVCAGCGKSFRAYHHLQSHNRIHTNERPYDCSVCGKHFTENSSLLRHAKIHKNDKQHQCSLCQKKFISLYSLRKHIIKHSGDKPFKCKQCNKKYSDPSSLSRHIKIHKTARTNEKTMDSETLRKDET